MPSRNLDDLDPVFRPLAVELLARLVEAKLCVLITCTRRSEAEQLEAIRTGHSRVAHSKHEDGLAIDLVLYSEFQLHGTDKLQWDATDPAWVTLGEIAESLGLRWGGRFRPLNSAGIGWDPGHVEYHLPAIEQPVSGDIRV